MSRSERPTHSVEDGSHHPIVLPPDLAAFPRGHERAALFRASDVGTLLLVKVPSRGLAALRGPIPIGLAHEHHRHPRSPVTWMLPTLADRPDVPLQVETFTNADHPDQCAEFAALGERAEVPLLASGEALRHRPCKRIGNTAAYIPAIVTAADRSLAAIPPDARDFECAKAEVMEASGW